MPHIYSTQDLLQILADERSACVNGQRLDLAAQPSGINPLLDRFIEPTGIQKFTAYEKFRATIHQYQRDHHVSGLIWPEITIGNATVKSPQIDDELISVTNDLRVLRAARPRMLGFWYRATESLTLFLRVSGATGFQPIDRAEIKSIQDRSAWAVLSCQGQGENRELILQLGWGKPEDAKYPRGLPGSFPESGSEFIHAVLPGRMPIG
jgi:hypothetical protein